ncbi:Hypothetical predicted protein, partial [Podarcis lilfordi]
KVINLASRDGASWCCARLPSKNGAGLPGKLLLSLPGEVHTPPTPPQGLPRLQ